MPKTLLSNDGSSSGKEANSKMKLLILAAIFLVVTVLLTSQRLHRQFIPQDVKFKAQAQFQSTLDNQEQQLELKTYNQTVTTSASITTPFKNNYTTNTEASILAVQSEVQKQQEEESNPTTKTLPSEIITTTTTTTTPVPAPSGNDTFVLTKVTNKNETATAASTVSNDNDGNVINVTVKNETASAAPIESQNGTSDVANVSVNDDMTPAAPTGFSNSESDVVSGTIKKETASAAPTDDVSKNVINVINVAIKDQTVPTEKKHIQFVFVVGLEGTGHHLMGEITKRSPAFARFKSLGKDFKEEFDALRKSLFQNSKTWDGLWTLHPCFLPKMKPGKMEAFLKEEYQRRVNTTATIMQRMENFVRRVNLQPVFGVSEDGPLLVIPVNTAVTGNGFGEVSYPNFRGKCREEQYPKLYSWYEACSLAQVDCRHVYLYRDVFEIFYSTTVKRGFNPDLRQGLQLYKKLSTDVLLPELAEYASHSKGCIGFYDLDHTLEWKDISRRLWQWSSAAEFTKMINRIYRPPHAKGNSTMSVEVEMKRRIAEDAKGKEGGVEKSMELLESWVESHKQILREVCHYAQHN